MGMGWSERMRAAWQGLAGVQASEDTSQRKTVAMPAVWSPVVQGWPGPASGQVLPKPTAANLRRFAEMPVARRAINCIKDRIAGMDWRIEAKPSAGNEGAGDRAERMKMLWRALEVPNAGDSFRTLIEPVIEDLLVGGFGAAEMELTGDASRPVRLWAVDGATVQVNARWSGEADAPRYAQVTGQPGKDGTRPLLNEDLMYVRLNPRTHSVFGLGKVEVAFESISQFLQAHRYAGRLAANSVVQYALWLPERTPEQHQRLIQWWQDEVEGTGRVPVLSSENKPEVLRFAGGTDADLHLGWQQFLLQMIANAFDLPAMMLGVTNDVNRSTASELADEAFQNAVVPVAKLLQEHITRDVIGLRLGWDDLRFVWSELESRDEMAEVEIQTKLLAAGVMTVDEVRKARGLAALPEKEVAASAESLDARDTM